MGPMMDYHTTSTNLFVNGQFEVQQREDSETVAAKLAARTPVIEGDPFFILWVESSGKPPRVKFAKLEEAEDFARDFARRIRKPVNVMKVVSTIEREPVPVRTTRYD